MTRTIEFKGLCRSFDGIELFKDLNYSIVDPKFVGIVGESGSGKSTLLYMMGGLLSPNSGSIIINNQDITKLNDRTLSLYRNRTIGFVFQFYNLIPSLSVWENIILPNTIAGIKPNTKDINELIDNIGLSRHKDKSVSKLSGGQQQRVAIARALVNNPNFILADEPTGNLDSKNTSSILNLLQDIRSKYNSSIVMVTHSEKTLNYCDRIITIEDGKVFD